MNPFWPQGRPIVVQTQGDAPARFRWGLDEHLIRDLSVHWRVHSQWWTGQPVWRDYWEVTTASGLLCVLYRDLLDGGWYLERIYE
jgi:hypothetical protein